MDDYGLTDENIADLMRAIQGDDAEKIRAELSENVRIALEVFCEICNQWNDSVADGDQGRSNNAIAIILYDDGSGKLATYFGGHDGIGEHINTQRDFESIEEAVETIWELM